MSPNELQPYPACRDSGLGWRCGRRGQTAGYCSEPASAYPPKDIRGLRELENKE